MLLLGALLVAGALAQTGTTTKTAATTTTADPLEDYDHVYLHTDVYLNLSVDNFYVNDSTFPFTTKNVVWRFSEIEMFMKTKDALNDHTYYSYPNEFTSNESMLWTYSKPCTSQKWAASGRSAINWSLGNWSDFLFVYSSYADRINYANFDQPYLQLTVEAFAADPNDTSCDPTKGTLLQNQTYWLELCFRQFDECNVWFGDSASFLYLNGQKEAATAKYGFRLQPSWGLSGQRVDLNLSSMEYLEVPDVIPSTNWGNVTASRIPWMEFRSVELGDESALKFTVRNGIIQRTIKTSDFTWAPGNIVDIVLDFTDSFDTSKAVNGMIQYNVSGLIEADYINADNIDPYWFNLVIINGPAGYDFGWWDYDFYIEGTDKISFGVKLTNDALTTTVAGATTTTTTAMPSTTKPPTMAQLVCAKDCGGRGVCIRTGVCQCVSGWSPDDVEGCINDNEKSKLTGTSMLTGATAPPVSMVSLTSTTGGTMPPKKTEATITTAKGENNKPPTVATGGSTTGANGATDSTADAASLVLSASLLLVAALAHF